ncbi:MAG TPA: membrane protein insertase YidC [Planctomycetota bacterium]|nr:membrane protein insertase YidC [Planctomycetota bacterium]
MDKRSTLTILLCFGIFVGWMYLQNKLWPPAKPVATTAKPVQTSPAAKPEPAKTAPGAVPAQAPGETAHYPVKGPITLTSKNLEVVLTNKGAGIERLTLLNYPQSPATVPILETTDPRWPHLAIREVGGADAIESLPWEIVEQTSDKVEFRYLLRNGIQITKILALDPTQHTLQMELMLDNKNPKPEGKDQPPPQKITLEILALNGMDLDSPYRYDQYLAGVWRYDKQARLKAASELKTGEGKMAAALALPAGPDRDKEIQSVDEKYFKVSGGLKEWMGIKNRFFTALLLPDNSALNDLDYFYFRDLPASLQGAQKGRQNVLVSAVTTPMSIEARKLLQFTLFAGPLEKDVLQAIPGAEDLAGYTGGCLPVFIVKPAALIILELLRLTSKVLNMGVAIIVTTLLIRLCLFPLSLKSQRNAAQMQALAPKIQALKERYKDDQAKYGTEQMRLFKENKVNPVAGCLPVFIQMPVFIGMYSVFEKSPILRHAPFVLWMKDLSEPDRLLGGSWGINIPLPILPDIHLDALNLLPILMTITWFLQAYFAPRSPDPQMAQQQKMMMYMPLLFGFSCYGLASGLSLYFLSNSLLSMAEQKIIKKYILKIPPGTPGGNNPQATMPFIAR